MKYSLIFLMLFTGCATTPPIKNFTCSMLNQHGVYINMGVGAHSMREAEDIANTVRDRLVVQNKLPADAWVECFGGMWMPHER